MPQAPIDAEGRPPRHRPQGEAESEALLNTVPLSHFVRVLRRHAWLVLGVVVAGVATFGTLAYVMVPEYRAVAVIRLSDPRRALTGGVVDDPARADGRFSDPLLSQAELLTSRKVAAAVVDRMPVLRLLAQDFPPSLLGTVSVAPTATARSLQLEFGRDSFVVRSAWGVARAAYGTPVDATDVPFTVIARPEADEGTVVILPREAAISRLIADLRVKRRLNTDIFDVSYTAADAHLAQQVVNHTVDVFQSTSAEAAQLQARQRREFLEGQLEVNDSLLADAREKLTVFRQNSGSYGSREALMREQIGLAGLELQRQQLHAERRTYQQILTALRDSGTSSDALQTALSTPGVTTSPAVTQLSRQLVEYETARDSLANRSALHPDLPRLNELVASTEERLVAAVRASVQSAIVALDGRIAALNDLRDRQRRLAATQDEEARLQERIDNLRYVADELRTEYQKAGIAEAVTVGHVEIVDRAVRPTEPVGLSLVEHLALGLLVGLALGGGGAFLAEHLGSSIVQRGQVEQLNLSVLGVIPHFKQATLEKDGETPDAVIEAYRGIRLAVMNAYGTDRPILVTMTSPGSGDGKSFVSSNLALAFAYANYRTLLIDADLRRGALHRPLDLPRRPGLTDFLVGDAALERAVRRTTHASLDLLASGSRRRDAPELMGSPGMTDLVAHLRSIYDVVVVDTPPLGAGVEALTLGTLAGNALLVLRLGQTDRALAEAKLELLRRQPLRLLGAVLNDVRQTSEYHAYSYYMDGYELTSEPLFRPLVARRKHEAGHPTG